MIFDYDGTCYDCLKLYGSSVRKAFERLKAEGYVPKVKDDDETLKRFLGMRADEMWMEVIPEAPSEVHKRAIKMVGEGLIKGAMEREAELFDGIEELLGKLKSMGHTLLILSNCPTIYKDAHMNAFDLKRYFDRFYASGEYPGLSKTEIFEIIRAEYPGKYCFIGDKIGDLEAGLRNGYATVACHYGYGSEEELKAASYHVYSVAELEDVLTSMQV
ncbi:MAG: HAD hydrolase-like protein [Eubacteriales bacterium]|nr:HAD hydrolase-like protein [Eubacteriales bacterium]